MEKLSPLGVFAFYCNVIFACGFDVFLLYQANFINEFEKMCGIVILVVYSALTVIAGRMVTVLTHKIYQESVQEGAREQLLIHPLKERSPDIDLPTVIFQAFRRHLCGKVLSLVVILCCTLIFLSMCIKAAFLLTFLAYFIINDMLIAFSITLGAAVIISFLNKYSEKQQETVQIMAMCSRFATALLGGGFFADEFPSYHDNGYSSIIGLYSLIFLAYQVTIPSLANASQQLKNDHTKIQIVAIAATLCCHIWLIFCTPYNPNRINNVPPSNYSIKIIHLIYAISTVCNAQIYWKAFTRMLKVWIFRVGGDSVAQNGCGAAIASFMLWLIIFLAILLSAISAFNSPDHFTFLANSVIQFYSFVLTFVIVIGFLFRSGRMKFSLVSFFSLGALICVLCIYGYFFWSIREYRDSFVFFFLLGILSALSVVIVVVVLLWRRYR